MSELFRARRAAFMVIAALFMIAPMAVVPAALSVSASPSMQTATTAGQDRTDHGDTDTPWQFFSTNVRRADSLGKWLALIFFTMVLTALYVPRLLRGVVVLVGVLALVVPRVRHSRLVRIGFAVFLLGVVPLAVAGRLLTDNALGFGFFYAFTQPIAAVMMALGAIQALLTVDNGLDRDVAALVAAAERSRPVWPDEPPLPEVHRVAARGRRAGRALVDVLGTDPGHASGASRRNVPVEQQAELALCEIYGVLPTAGETVYDAGSTREENSQVGAFWRRKVYPAKKT